MDDFPINTSIYKGFSWIFHGYVKYPEGKIQHNWLVFFRNPSEKSWSSSVGMMTFPIYGKS